MRLCRFLPQLLTVAFLSATPLAHAAAPLNIKDFGATGNGKTLDSAAIQKAIDACSSQGGGTVQIPPGTFLTGTILLKDNVTLSLDAKATLLGSTNLEDYQNVDPFTDGLGIQVGWALLAGVKAHNIAVTGGGTIDGQGKALAERQGGQASKVWGRRPFLVRMVECDGVKLDTLTLHYSAAWTTNFFHCKNISVENVTILSRGVPHNDGIDIDGCQSVHIANCDIDSGDDSICFKTTSSAMACKDIDISNCKLKSSQGAIKTGTESMANFENIKISKCQIRDTSAGGIKLLAVDGANIKNVDISDITMTNVQTPIFIRLGKRLSVFRPGEQKQSIGSIDNVSIRNIKAQAANGALKPPTGMLITGIPDHPITNLTLENIEISLPGGGSLQDAHRSVIEEEPKLYPEVNRFAPGLPAYGIYARHIKNFSLSNLTLKTEKPDLRPAVICEDAANIQLSNLSIPSTTGAESVIRFESTTTAQISGLNFAGSAKELISSDANSSAIQIAK